MGFFLRFFFLNLIYLSSLSLHAYSAKNDVKDLKEIEKKMASLVKSFHAQNYSYLALKFLDTPSSLMVSRVFVEGDNLVIELTPPFKKEKILKAYPLESLGTYYDLDNHYFELIKDQVRLYFVDFETMVNFQVFMKKLVSFKRVARLCCEKIFSKSFFEGKKSKFRKIKSKLSDEFKIKIERMKSSFVFEEVMDILDRFSHKKKFESEKDPDGFYSEESDIRKFFEYTLVCPKLIRRLPLENLANLLKIAASKHSHIASIREMNHHFFIKGSRHLNILLQEKALENGERIKNIFEKNKMGEDEFFDLLRAESDLMFLCVLRNQVQQEKIDEERFFSGDESEDSMSPKSSLDYMYNFDELVRHAQFRIFLLYDQYKIHLLKNPKNILIHCFDEDRTKENLKKKRDFSFRGRWEQAGQALKGMAKISFEVKKDKIKFFSRIHAEVLARKTFKSSKTYQEAMRKLSQAKISDSFSALEFLSVIEVKDLFVLQGKTH